jgi:hypothetical protein
MQPNKDSKSQESEHRGRPSKFLTKEQVLAAQSKTLSNRAAARYLGMSYPTYKQYAKLYKDEATGLSLFEAHKNEAGKGIPKFLNNEKKKTGLIDILEGRVPHYHFNPKKIKHRVIFEGLIAECCNRCGFAERRVTDHRIPLILHHKDRNARNYRLENLELLCYNCSFLYVTSAISEEQVAIMEDYKDAHNGVEEFDWELDEHHLEHLKSLGLVGDDPALGSEYISKL